MEQHTPQYEEAYGTLKEALLFKDLDDDTIKGILDECKEVHWKRGETIDPEIGMREMYVIIKGRLKITRSIRRAVGVWRFFC